MSPCYTVNRIITLKNALSPIIIVSRIAKNSGYKNIDLKINVYIQKPYHIFYGRKYLQQN